MTSLLLFTLGAALFALDIVLFARLVWRSGYDPLRLRYDGPLWLLLPGSGFALLWRVVLWSRMRRLWFTRAQRTITLDLMAARNELAYLEECYREDQRHPDLVGDIVRTRTHITALETRAIEVAGRLSALTVEPS